MTWDFIVYDKDSKEVITCVLEMEKEPKYLINVNYVAVYLPHDEYRIKEIDGVGYFESLQDKVIYLDEYRGRYED